MTLTAGRIFVLFALLILPFAGWSQSVDNDQPDSLPVTLIEPIAINEIISEVDEAYRNIKQIESKIKIKIKINEIDSLFPRYIKIIEKDKNNAEVFIKSNPNRQKIDNLIKRWQGIKNHFDKWENEISQNTQRNILLLETVDLNSKRWELTYQNAISQNLPPKLIDNIKKVLDDYNKLKLLIISEDNKYLEVQVKVNNAKNEAVFIIDQLNDLKNSELYQLFYLRHEPLWRTEVASDHKESLKGVDAESFTQNVKNSFDFVLSSESDLYLFFYC